MKICSLMTNAKQVSLGGMLSMIPVINEMKITYRNVVSGKASAPEYFVLEK